MDKNRRRREHDNDVSPSIKLDFLVIKGDNVFSILLRQYVYSATFISCLWDEETLAHDI